MSMKAKLKERRKLSSNDRNKSGAISTKIGLSPKPSPAKPQNPVVFDISKLNEPILPDDYKIYGDYLYVADGKVYRSDWHDITVKQLKINEGFYEIRRCDVHGRKAQIEAQQ